MSTAPVSSSALPHLELLERLARSGLLEDCQPPIWLPSMGTPSPRSAVATISGGMSIGGHVFKLRVKLPSALSLYLPEVIVESETPRLELPHLLGERRLCFEAGANLLDRREPWAILRESILYARKMLEEMLAGNRAREFVQEAVAYWRSLAEESIDCVVAASEHPHRTMALFGGGRLCAVADDPSRYVQSLPGRSAAGLWQKSAIYLPLDPAAVDSSFTPGKLKTPDGLRTYIRALPEEDRRALSLLLTSCEGQEEFLVLGLRRPHGERALLGARLVGIQGGHPLEHAHAQAWVEPIDLLRRDHAYLAPRGGAGTELQGRRVLLAGCGAVGGYLALALARAGVGGLSLVDPDSFELENTYRHVCGMAWSDHPKVLGLKAEIERAIPYISVNAHEQRIEDLLTQNPSMLREHDLIISALGHPTFELELNEWIWSQSAHPPALFAWLEPLGLGGHVLLTHAGGAEGPVRGCLECLHHRPIEGGALKNRAAFAKADAIYTRDTLGCGSRYLPFADLDAQRTAELAARLALRALRREVTESPLLSWKGERQPFEAAGYSVTERYAADPGQLEAQRLSYIRDDCPVCARG
ncbi:hypothetical protein BO221_16515 [Archangium sp. Cb G35]|uniref:ThiF family adenylyltransferase n=1 Tax=Archangium sp. Cb G35 TaxID=1920190 RepID=UPI0009357B27|nr:ThiF family adenylyltransferase [Archangium sp. Cb G35]OJT23604.1 hypothetical protein BO221_16515 [Archangium sp. Cb G35]